MDRPLDPQALAALWGSGLTGAPSSSAVYVLCAYRTLCVTGVPAVVFLDYPCIFMQRPRAVMSPSHSPGCSTLSREPQSGPGAEQTKSGGPRQVA